MRRLPVTMVAAVFTAALVVVPSAPAASAAVGATVEVRNTEFAPQAVRIEPGQAVEWRTRDSGHTVTSDDMTRAAFRFPESGTLSAGQVVSHTFADAGVYTYRCELHGATNGYPNGMTGAVYVGVDPAETAPQTRLVPSKQYPTMTSAVDGIPAGSTILVKPGVYRLTQEVQLSADALTLRPSDSTGVVVFEPATADVDVGIVVGRDTEGVTVERVTTKGFGWAGVLVDTARQFSLRSVTVHASGGRYGVRALYASGGSIMNPIVSGASGAAVSITECEDYGCPAVVGGQVTASDVGVSVDGDAVVSVQEVVIDAVSTGVRITGVVGALVSANTVRSGASGAEGIAVRGPSTNVLVIDNVVSTPFGLRWDGVGAGVCFSRNTNGRGAPATSDPPALQTLFPCP